MYKRQKQRSGRMLTVMATATRPLDSKRMPAQAPRVLQAETALDAPTATVTAPRTPMQTGPRRMEPTSHQTTAPNGLTPTLTAMATIRWEPTETSAHRSLEPRPLTDLGVRIPMVMDTQTRTAGGPLTTVRTPTPVIRTAGVTTMATDTTTGWMMIVRRSTCLLYTSPSPRD